MRKRGARGRLAALAGGAWLIAAASAPAAEPTKVDLTQWPTPDVAGIGNSPAEELVRYGRTLFTDTANTIGPTVADPTKRFAGNNLKCESCHLAGGTTAY